MSNQQTNTYLEQVVQQKASVDRELRNRKKMVLQDARAAAPAPLAGLANRVAGGGPPGRGGGGGEDGGRAIDYRITGFWRWRTVVVPPNVHVVHTRRGREKPVNIGLGRSFRYDPYTDSFLLVPAAVQTIIINANCICRELQGILVQAYVQWVVADIEIAYRRLDFSDTEDPMRIVDVQLREQAEAALKDKVSTMSIHDVLSDKQPLIQELTQRLRQVAEGSGDAGDEGLGLKIVTVQLKEAVVSSTRLWTNLQRPFRAEREKLARMAELESQREIAARELEYRKTSSVEELAVDAEIAQRTADAERARFDREHSEQARRQELEQAQEQATIRQRRAVEVLTRTEAAALQVEVNRLETERLERERALQEVQMQLDAAKAARARAERAAALELQDMEHAAAAVRRERELALERTQRAIDNDLSETHLRAQLVEKLPEIASALPTPEALRSIQIGGADGPAASLAGLLAAVMAAAEGLADRAKGED